MIYSMNKLIFITFFLFASCNHSSKIEVEEKQLIESSIDKEAEALLAQDKKNKLLELEYLEQIRIAQENNDTEAFEFFFQEYVDVERLEIPKELKENPNYFKGGLKIKY